MNQRRPSPTAPPASKPPQTPKRRGRPRSPVFGHFQRIVSESGEFQGNKCRYCPFTSRDRSENPTYLTRHILRSCDAPQDIKDAMGARHPSISMANFAPGGRYNFQKTATLAATPSPMVSTSSGTLTEHQTVNPSPDQIRQIQVPLQRSTQEHPPPLPPTTVHPASVQVSAAAIMAAQQPVIAKAQPHQHHIDPQRSTQVGPSRTDQFIVPTTSSQSIVRSSGVTKSRRGRPRSPALLYFHRHVDDKGNFLANKCAHCQFVSRDRSENSTLLLRHLLSPACGTPEEIRVILRGNRYTADGKRTSRGGKSANAAARRNIVKAASDALTDVKDDPSRDARDGRIASSQCVNPEGLAVALIRLFVRHELDFRTVESMLLADLIGAITSQPQTNNGTQGDNAIAYPPQQLPNAAAAARVLPSWSFLDTFWKRTPVSRFLIANSAALGQPSSKHLMIYFPDLMTPSFPHNAPQSCITDDESNSSKAVMIASAFLWTSGAHLEYVGSKNCARDFRSSITELVRECQREHEPGKISFDQVFIGRPLDGIGRSRDIPRNDSSSAWIADLPHEMLPDVPREIDILTQDLLSQVPLLARCIRRNKILASYFRESYSNRAAVMLFGRNLAEKEQCARYMAHIANPVQFNRCQEALENAKQTYEILLHAQSSHKDRQRLQETGSFLHTISEENAGNVQLCQEITRLVLSQPYRNELKVFITVMEPLANLMAQYSCADQQAQQGDPSIFSDYRRFHTRSLACLLPDCVRTLREIYTEKTPEFESDLRFLRGITACRLIGKGGDVYPPIVGEVCYLAAFLHPYTNLSTVKGITVEEAWRRASSFLQSNFQSRGDVVLERAMEQLQNFHQRGSVFSVSEIFNGTSESEDPRLWWEKHGNLAPDLCVIALKVLNAPTAAFPVVKHMAEVNARQSDLRGLEKDMLMEKKRLLYWNLRLSEDIIMPKELTETLKPSAVKAQ